MPLGRRILSLGAGAAVLILGAATMLTHADASVSQATVVSADPADNTPNVMDDEFVGNAAVHALSHSGPVMYAGGEFHTIANAARTVRSTRHNLMAFTITTGAILPFDPTVDGRVWSVHASGSFVYVAGEFRNVNGVARRSLVKLDGATGAIVTEFNPVLPTGTVYDVKLVGGRLVIAGSFAKRLMALDPTTGADTNYINLNISGTVAENAGATDVLRFAVNPAGTRLVALGNFTSVAGATRHRAFMANLETATATLNAWDYAPLRSFCNSAATPAYLRDVDFAPDGSYFVLVGTGGYVRSAGDIGSTVCDAAARFDTNVTAPAKPVWLNYTGGDTLLSVAVTGAAVYVQGHQRWVDNPLGRNAAGPGAVERAGIAALAPANGKALPWNPGKGREDGGRDLYATAQGLWVASDARTFRGEVRWGLAYCPL